MFNKIHERYGLEECFIAREAHNDESFIRQYLTQADCEELNLFSIQKQNGDLYVEDVSDEEGWKNIKNTHNNTHNDTRTHTMTHTK